MTDNISPVDPWEMCLVGLVDRGRNVQSAERDVSLYGGGRRATEVAEEIASSLTAYDAGLKAARFRRSPEGRELERVTIQRLREAEAARIAQNPACASSDVPLLGCVNIYEDTGFTKPSVGGFGSGPSELDDEWRRLAKEDLS